jgi:hypothetical protein
MPAIPQVKPLTIQAPQLGQGIAVEIGYMIVSGLLAGFSPLLFLASLFLGALLFIYNKSRIPQYTRYYIIGAFVIFFAFEYRMTLPGGIDSSLFGFQMMMVMGVLSLLLALVLVLYGGGATSPAIDYAASTGHGLVELLIYNLCAMVPSAAIFTVLSMNRLSLHTKLANNRESILLIGTIILVLSVLIVEVLSLLS